MTKPVIMPQVGQDIESGRILEWYVKEGDAVKKGDILAVVESDKASFEVEAYDTGTVLKLLYSAGDEAKIFDPIAYIGEPGESLNSGVTNTESFQPEIAMPESDTEPTGKKETSNLTDILAAATGTDIAVRINASPSAKRTAQENNIEISVIPPTGPNLRIIKRDVLNYLKNDSVPSPKATPVAKRIASLEGIEMSSLPGSGSGGKIVKEDVLESIKLKNTITSPKSSLLKPDEKDSVIVFSKLRKRIAERLTFSKQTIPHYYLLIDVNVNNITKWRKKTFDQLGLKISFNDVLIKLVASTLQKYPKLNSYVDDEKLILKPNINIGVAVSVEDGLLVPIISDADSKNINEINVISKKNAEDARRGIVNLSALGTFTISNLGMFGIKSFYAIINPPESAILSVGAVEKRVIPDNNDNIIVATMVSLGLAVDHRAIDGAYASEFLKELKNALESFDG